ncbi:MAG: gamma-glutamylcyclotransferase [Verrucomicrobia bacterium]|nr:gamma-glutamylcyclotransferase [Cytophagales bacterium]
MKSAILYFSYGSNMDAESMKKNYPKAVFKGPAFLENYKFVYTSFLEARKRGGADMVASENEKVWGLLYEMNIDEMVDLDKNKTNLYERITVKVNVNTQTLEVQTYVLKDKSLVSSKPSPEYVDLLVSLAKKYYFPESYINYLKS